MNLFYFFFGKISRGVSRFIYFRFGNMVMGFREGRVRRGMVLGKVFWRGFWGV